MPLLGFGTWQIQGRQARVATEAALEAGYRHIDTAHVYGNEQEVGEAISASGVPRGELFVTTKVPPDHEGRERETLLRSLELLGTGHVDLWLVHWSREDDIHADMWNGMREARDEGLVRDVGVSNYSLDQMDRLEAATGERPAVNQIEWSPLLFDATVLRGHRDRNIVLEGYSGLRGGVLEHPAVTEIAARLERTPAQVVIRWHLEHDVVVIPKSERPQRIASNADVTGFVLEESDVEALDELAR